MDGFAGIDIGGTSIKIGIIDEQGTKLAERQFPADVTSDIDIVFEGIVAKLKELAQEISNNVTLKAMGIGVPGEVNVQDGILREPVNLPGWDDAPLVDIMKSKMSCPVFLDNDANVAALGEYTFGSGRNYDEMMMITLGTGVGGGLILRGEIYRGADNVTGEIGHTIVQAGGKSCRCGRLGCLEAYVGAGAIVRYTSLRLDHGENSTLQEMPRRKLTAKSIAEAALDGDELARAVYERAGYYLGIGLGNVANLLNLQRIVIGGGVAQAGDIFFKSLQKSFNDTALCIPGQTLEIVPAELGEKAGMLGAAWMAVKHSK